MPVLYADEQINDLAITLEEKTEGQQTWAARLKSAESDFRSGALAFMEANEMEAKIKLARESPQESKILQAIHEAHKAEKSAANEVEKMEHDLEALREEAHVIKGKLSRLQKQKQTGSKQVRPSTYM